MYRTLIRTFFQIRIRPDPDPDSFFKLESGRNRTRIFFFQIKIRPDPDIRQKLQYPAGSGPER